jgi:uncharacterized protein (DUF1330 family)
MGIREPPAFILIEVAAEHADQVNAPADWATLARQAGGTLFAAAPPGRVTCLEPGTVGSSLVIARFTSRAMARSVAHEVLLPRLRSDLPITTIPTLLVVDSLPDEGLPALPDIPTAASVPCPPSVPRNTFLVVRGTSWDQARLDAYRDVILPMHKDLGAYYEAFAIEQTQVEAMSGQWNDRIFAISRWPSRAAAETFWFSERYQLTAIPLRLGAGRFTVHALDAVD